MMTPKPTIEAFDLWLYQKSIQLEAIVIGGAALALLGVINRQTRDFDILQPNLSDEVLFEAKEFAKHLRNQGVELGNEWLNNGPSQVAELLPKGWETRLQPLFNGHSLTLTTLGRPDLLKTKLFALCDRGTDLFDCLALAPSSSELIEATPWLEMQDTNPMWPEHVKSTLKNLEERLAHDL